MSKAISKNRDGVTFDSGLISSLNSSSSYIDLIRRHPLLSDPKRLNVLRSLTEKPADKVNWNQKDINRARKEMEEVMIHNDKMLEKGYDPVKDEKVFKKVDQNLMLKVFQLFGFK